MAILNATEVILKVDTGSGKVAVAYSTSASLSVSMDLRDKTSKSSLGWSESLGGLKSWEMSGDAFVDIAATGANVLNLWTVWETGNAIDVEFGAAGIVYTGSALITSISIDAGVEENATYSISLTGTAALSQNA